MLRATIKNKRTRSSLSVAYHLRCPRPAKTLVDEAEGRMTIKQFGFRVFIIKNLQFANNSFLVWAQGCMCLGFPVSSIWCVWVERDCCLTAAVGWPTSARHRQKSEPNHCTCTNNHDVFLVQLARISHDQRITFEMQLCLRARYHQNRELRAPQRST